MVDVVLLVFGFHSMCRMRVMNQRDSSVCVFVWCVCFARRLETDAARVQRAEGMLTKGNRREGQMGKWMTEGEQEERSDSSVIEGVRETEEQFVTLSRAEQSVATHPSSRDSCDRGSHQ